MKWTVILGFGLCMGACNSSPEQGVVRTLYGAFDPAAGLPELSLRRTRSEDPDVYLVQFFAAITPAQRDAITATGATLRTYFPDHSYIVKATAAQAEKLAALAAVRTVTPYPDLLRLGASLVHTTDDGAHIGAPATGPMTVAVECADGIARTQVAQDITTLGGVVLSPSAPPTDRWLLARLTADHITALLDNPDILAIEEHVPKHLHNDIEYGELQAGKLDDAVVWNHTLHGENQTVAISDGALAQTSCRFLSSNYLKILDYVEEPGTTFTDPTMFLHGTHVAGTLLGDDLNNGVYDLQDGMAPAALLYFEALGDNLAGVPVDLATLFQPAYTAGARVHSNSWGTTDNSVAAYDATARSIDAFVWAHPDYLVVFSTGNTGPALGTVSNPANAKNLIAVGSMNAANPNDVSAFSSHGPTSDGRIKPTLIAAGENVISAAWSANPNGPVPGVATCATLTQSGTSMAAANLAGAATLVRQYFVDGFYPTGNANTPDALAPSAALVKSTLIASAGAMNGSNTDSAFPSTGQGFGRVQLDNALYFADAATAQRLWVRDVNTGITTGQVQSFTVHLTNTGPLKIVLTWMDAEPSANASVALVNNLDLTLTGPGGVVYLGNVLTAGISTPGGQADALNVEEIVTLPAAAPGTYTIRVVGTNVPGNATAAETGPQPYALAAVGAILPADLSTAVDGSTSGSASGATSPDSSLDPGAGATTVNFGGVNKSSCNSVATNDALLILLVGLFYLLPKPPRRRRARIKRR